MTTYVWDVSQYELLMPTLNFKLSKQHVPYCYASLFEQHAPQEFEKATVAEPKKPVSKISWQLNLVHANDIAVPIKTYTICLNVWKTMYLSNWARR